MTSAVKHYCGNDKRFSHSATGAGLTVGRASIDFFCLVKINTAPCFGSHKSDKNAIGAMSTFVTNSNNLNELNSHNTWAR